MSVDTGRLLRIRSAIRAALESAERPEGGRSPFAGEALRDAYNKYLEELIGLFQSHEDLVAELLNLFPEFNDRVPGNRDLFRSDAFTSKAASLLSQLGGWVDGMIEEAQMQMNAQAYAEARLKEERGIGFRPDS